MRKFLDLVGLDIFITRLKLLFLDKKTYNEYVEYQPVPPEGIQLEPGYSVMWVHFNYGQIIKQIEVYLTETEPSVPRGTFVVQFRHPRVIDDRPIARITVNNFFIPGITGEDSSTFAAYYKKEIYMYNGLQY